MIIKYAKSKIGQVFTNIDEFRGFVKKSSKSSDKSLYKRVANKLKEIELPDDLENYIILRNRAISSMELWGCNQNYDAFPDNELKTKYSTFNKCRIDVDHICEDEEKDVIGIVLDSVYVEPKIYRRGRFIDFNENDVQNGDQVVGGYIENLWAIHKDRAEAHTPGLVTGILNGEVTDSSMGSFVEEAECSICGKTYTDAKGVCTAHIGKPYFEPYTDNYGRPIYKLDANGNRKVNKDGQWVQDGDWHIDYSGKKGQYHLHNGKKKLAFEINHGLNFFEDSVILSEEFAKKSGKRAEAGGEGADNRAKILEHIPTDGFINKKKSLLDMIKKVSINESVMKDEYVKIGEEPNDIKEGKEELKQETIDKLEEGESDKIMTNYSRFKNLVINNDWKTFKSLVANKLGVAELSLIDSVNLKNFYKKSLNEQIVFKIKEMRKNNMKDKQIEDKLLEMGFDKSAIEEGLVYDKHFGASDVVKSIKKHILEGIDLYHKAIVKLPNTDNMNSGAPSDRMDYQKHVDDDEIGQKPFDRNEATKPSESIQDPLYTSSQLYIKKSESSDDEDIESYFLDEEVKEVKNPDGKIVYNDEEITKESQFNNKMAKEQLKNKSKDSLANGRGIDRYDGKYNDKEQDLSQKKVNLEDYKDHKNVDKDYVTSDSGAVHKDRKLPKEQTKNRIGESTSDFKDNVGGYSKNYPNPYKEDLKTKEMIWKVKSLLKIKSALDPVIRNGDLVKTENNNLGVITAIRKNDYEITYVDGTEEFLKASQFIKTFSVNEQADELKESYDENRENYVFENAIDLQKSQEKNNNSDSDGNLEDYLEDDYIETHTDRNKKKKSNLNKKSMDGMADANATVPPTVATNTTVPPTSDATIPPPVSNPVENIGNSGANIGTIINQSKLEKYADDWSPEDAYKQKAEQDVNMVGDMKPKRPKTTEDGLIKEEVEGGGDLMKPIAKKSIWDTSYEKGFWKDYKGYDINIIMSDSGDNRYEYNVYKNGNKIKQGIADTIDNALYDAHKAIELIKESRKIKSAFDEIEEEDNKYFNLDGDDIVDLPNDVEQMIQQKEDELINSLTKEKWAILTATKESLAVGTEYQDKAGLLPENLERNEQLKQDIVAMGYNPIAIKGIYKKQYQGDSYLVYNIVLRDAFVLGAKYEQESILIPEGLLYTKDITEEQAKTFNIKQAKLEPVKINKSTGHFDYTIGEKAKNEDFYSTFRVGDSEINLSLGIKFGNFIPYSEFPEYVKQELEEKQELDEAMEQHEKLDTVEKSDTDLLNVDLIDDTDELPELPEESEEESEEDKPINFDDLSDEDLDLEDDEEDKPKRSKKIVGGVMPTDLAGMQTQKGKPVVIRNKDTGSIIGEGTASNISSGKDTAGNLETFVEINGNPADVKSSNDYLFETKEPKTSILHELMSLNFSDDDLDINKKTAGIDELSFDIDLSDVELSVTAEASMGGQSVGSESSDSEMSSNFFEDTEVERQPDRSKGKTKRKKGGLGIVNKNADRSKLNRNSIDMDDNFFED